MIARNEAASTVFFQSLPDGGVVGPQQSFHLQRMQVFHHPEHVAGAHNRVVVAVSVLTLEEIEEHVVRAFRAEVQEGTHLAARAVEAQDVALVEVHAHHVGSLSAIAVGETFTIPSCKRGTVLPGSSKGQRDVGPLRSTAQGDMAARLRAAANPARTRLQTLALYINKVDAGRLGGDERRVAALLHLKRRRLEQLAVGRVDAHMHGT